MGEKRPPGVDLLDCEGSETRYDRVRGVTGSAPSLLQGRGVLFLGIPTATRNGEPEISAAPERTIVVGRQD
ncbi:MAG: hypothetical protein C0510_00115 [Erythrobacter sp.]|nr:hypothetical protein [Erythrobacter sp.]